MSKSHENKYKLGDNATLFWDPISRTKITKNAIVEIPASAFKKNERLKIAKQRGHIVPATEEDMIAFENFKKGLVSTKEEPVDSDTADSDNKDELGKKTVKELLAYVEETYELEEEEFEALTKLTKKADLISAIRELEAEAEEEED